MKSTLAFVALLVSCCLATDTITVKNLKVYVNCEEYFIKAMCYSPTPLGASNPQANYNGGLCSTHENVFGAQESGCDDFFDGATYPNRNPPGPQDGWFTGAWQRDFPAMQELGVNTIRLYHASPFTRNYSIAAMNSTFAGQQIVAPDGVSHVPFMDLAHQYGFKVIFPLPGDQNLLMSLSEDDMHTAIQNIIDEIGNHPALLMWGFGNELPLGDSLVDLLNGYMAFARQYQMQKWNRWVPITVAVVDYPPSYDQLAATLQVDVFSTNAGYRGLGFSDLWTGDPYQNFSGWAILSQRYDKPLFISEVGWMQSNNSINYAIPNWFNQIYSNAIANQHYGLVGVAFFEFSDELTKADPTQQDMGVVHYLPATDQYGNSSVDANVWIPDILVQKPMIFESVKNGTFNNVSYNYNADAFVLLGRHPDVLNASECGLQSVDPSGAVDNNVIVDSGSPFLQISAAFVTLAAVLGLL